ncbi:MAG: protease complex subunit PrcB family protein [Chlamydiota bacterium]
MKRMRAAHNPKRLLVLCLLVGSARAACAGDVAFRKLCGGDDAVYGVKKTSAAPELALARDGDEMRRIWAEDVTGAYRDSNGMPAVDWKSEFVVAVFIGARPSAGYAARIEGVALKGKVLEVTVRESAPSPAPAGAARAASPYAMAVCSRAGVPLADILMLRLAGGDGRVLVERPAWSYRMMDSSPGAAGAKGAR